MDSYSEWLKLQLNHFQTRTALLTLLWPCEQHAGKILEIIDLYSVRRTTNLGEVRECQQEKAKHLKV